MKDSTLVVHLVREANDINLFKRYIESYRLFPAGVKHNLLILYKGFKSSDLKLEQCRALVNDLKHDEYHVSDEGFDITVYIKVTKSLHKEFDYFCFFNSHASILSPDWLHKMVNAFQDPSIGLVGATGSWVSHRGRWNLATLVLSGFKHFLKYAISRTRLNISLSEFLREINYLINYKAYPNEHIRTNAFLIKGKDMLQFENMSILSKRDAYLFESGKDGLSETIRKQGKSIAIVDTDGKVFHSQHWDKASITWQRGQSKLLVSDNFTRMYDTANIESKEGMEMVLWNGRDNNYSLGEYWYSFFMNNQYKDKIERQKSKLTEISEQGSATVVIYGAGELGRHFYHWIQNNTPNLTVKCFIDGHSKFPLLFKLQVLRPNDAIKKMKAIDYVLISSNKFYDEIQHILISYKLKSEKVV